MYPSHEYYVRIPEVTFLKNEPSNSVIGQAVGTGRVHRIITVS